MERGVSNVPGHLCGTVQGGINAIGGSIPSLMYRHRILVFKSLQIGDLCTIGEYGPSRESNRI